MNPVLQRIGQILFEAFLRYLDQNPEVLTKLIDLLIKQIAEGFERVVNEAQKAGGQTQA